MQDLNLFGFKNDLTRAVQTPQQQAQVAAQTGDASGLTTPAAAPAGAVYEPLPISDLCRQQLGNLFFYECGLTASEAAARAIAKRVCSGDQFMSSTLIQQVMNLVYRYMQIMYFNLSQVKINQHVQCHLHLSFDFPYLCVFFLKFTFRHVLQALIKLHAIALENSWNQHPLNVINEFLRLLLSIEDGLQLGRLQDILLQNQGGFAVVAHQEA